MVSGQLGQKGPETTPPPAHPTAEHSATHLSFQATWETEIWRIMVPDQSGQNICGTQSQWQKLSMVAHTCHPSFYGKLKIGGP
jgi:hypothetical protein